MGEVLTVEAVLDGRLDALLHPAAARREAGARLPGLVAARLTGELPPSTRVEWAQRLSTETWPVIRRERGERWDLGWSELTAGLALAVELLEGELPSVLFREIQGTPAEDAWRRARTRFQRFVLLVDSAVHVRRMFARPGRRDLDAPVEESVDWSVDGPAFRDRSHTLMLALLADGTLADHVGPVAATGELLPDGHSVGPAGSLVEKAKEWRRQFPDGLLVSGPPSGFDPDTWQALLRASGKTSDHRDPQWIVGATLSEIRAKLTASEGSIASWDGASLPQGAVLEPRLSPGEPGAPEPIKGDALFDACWAAWRDSLLRGPRRGVLIEGRPGAGKSVLSCSLEWDFARTALGAFGFGIRIGARELAAVIERKPAVSWSEGLAARDAERAVLFESLEKSGRLVPVVDGLDELQPAQLQAVSAWLRAGSGWWIATSRPLEGSELPPSWNLSLADLERDDATSLLIGLGRDDLVGAIWPEGRYRQPPAELQELIRTPLHVSLLARVVSPQEDLRSLEAHELYARAFEALLDHACCSRRLSMDGAGLVRRLLSTVVGELALAWLQSEQGVLRPTDIDAAFEALKMSPPDQVRALEALEFGHLLVPAAGAWEFGHRTMAEWAAASALHRRVERALLGGPDGKGAPVSRALRAEAEVAAIEPFLADGAFAHRGRWTMLLRFYAPFVEEPLSLLDRLLGPAHVSNWRLPVRRRSWMRDSFDERLDLRPASATEILESWAFAYEILRVCRWRRACDARVAWALGVRRWLLVEPEGRRRGYRGELDALRAFSAAIGEHLPLALDELVVLAVRTASQRTVLAADPLVLLPAVPAARAAVFSGLLESGEREQQLAVIEWYSQRGLEVPRTVLDQLAHIIPSELHKARESRGHDAATLSRLEAAVWNVYLAHGDEPPWPVVRRRFGAWPSHLADHLLRWFGTAPEPGSWSARTDDAYRRRRELLAVLVDSASREEHETIQTLGGVIDDSVRDRVLRRIGYFIDQADDLDLLRTAKALASSQGWSLQRSWDWRPIAEEAVASAVRDGVVRLHRLRTRASRLIGALDDSVRLDRIVGELWVLLPPENPARREILLAVGGTKLVPQQIAARELIRYHGSAAWRLDATRWTPAHLEQLHAMGSTASGQLRYEAVRLLARASGRDELTELARHLPSEDEAFTALVYERIAQRQWLDEDDAAPAVPDPSRLPLSYQAARDAPGWRAALMARLAADDVADVATLAELVIRHEVREALPFLAQCLAGNEFCNRPVLKAIGLLAGALDENVARIALRHALRFGWPDGRSELLGLALLDQPALARAGAKLAGFLKVEDLDVLAEGSVSALRHPSLAAALRGLGPVAVGKLLDLHAAAARHVAECEAASSTDPELERFFGAPPASEVTEARRRRDALAETVLATVDARMTSPAELVEILRRVATEDVHEVFGLPGPLGSEYDEPGDMDWQAEQANQNLVGAAATMLEESLASQPDQWRVLRQLFAHPSESLRKRVFELCADRAEPHEVAGLALDALEGHLRGNRTRWTGQTAGLFLAGQQSGAGSVNVERPDTASSLVAAVRGRLTPAHSNVVRDLAKHRLPTFRALAARWAGELGDEGWSAFLEPLFEDAEPVVVRATVEAVALLAPASLDRRLLELRDSSWTPAHDAVLLSRLRSQFGTMRSAVSLAEHVSQATLLKVLGRAAGRAVVSRLPDTRGGADDRCFRGFPCLVEHVLDDWPSLLGEESQDVFREWLEHEAPTVRAVGRRLLAARGSLTAAELEPQLRAPLPADRFSAAECVVRMGIERLGAAAVQVMRDSLAEPATDDDAVAGDEEPDEEALVAAVLRRDALRDPSELRRRVLWALRGATPAFAEAVALVANRIPFDHVQSCVEPEGEEIVDEVTALIHGWGEAGAIAILDLVDRGEVEDDPSFMWALRQAAEAHPSVLAAVRERAKGGGCVSSRLLAEIEEREYERDLQGLVGLLEDEIFPPGWPELP